MQGSELFATGSSLEPFFQQAVRNSYKQLG